MTPHSTSPASEPPWPSLTGSTSASPPTAAPGAPHWPTSSPPHSHPGPVRMLDVGCGSGATTRWLAPLLPGPQEWTLLDRDPALLALIPERTAHVRDRDGAPVTCSTRRAEITALTARDLATTSAVTASALVDVLTADEVDGLAATCAAARVPALLTLSVTGRVELDPFDPSTPRSTPRSLPPSTPTSGAPSQGGGCSVRTPPPRPRTPSADTA